MPSKTSLVVATLSFPIVLKLLSKYFGNAPRTKRIGPQVERVVILGASSGIGRSIAHQYAERGARVCIVGRRWMELAGVEDECRQLQENCKSGMTEKASENDVLSIVADFTVPEDMIRVRDELQQEWGGFDTLVVSAGVSALQPLLAVAGMERDGNGFSPDGATVEGVASASRIATAALRGNYIGPLVAAVTLIPLLTKSSQSPSILLLSSLAAVIPAPTRSLYASTKGASLLLYQSLAIEHPEINFSFVLPSTVEGGFRSSAVDKGPVREADPNSTGLKKDYVARRCIQAVDRCEKTIFLHGFYRWGHLLYWLWPSFVESKARKKYNFTA